MEKLNILVTGGTGYIGSHTVVELQQEGYEVTIVDNLSNSRIEVLNGIEKITGIRPAFEKIDLSDPIETESFFGENNKFAGIIHFAALKAVGESVQKPLLYYRNNLYSLINILDAMKKYQIPNLVFSSSCTIYVQPDILPVTENAPVKKAESPYGNTKQIAEEIIQDFIHSVSGFAAIALRYFNPIGAHESSCIGELPNDVPSNLVPFITQTAYGIRECLRIFGKDYQTPDGTCIRDYLHVVDLAQGHVIAVKRMIDKKFNSPFEYFNLGTGSGTSVFELVKTFEKVTGQKLNYQLTDRRAGDIEQIWADTSKANRELGWKTKKSLEDTLLSAWNWEKEFRKK
jgi:UDP-glucose 4-epimerase